MNKTRRMVYQSLALALFIIVLMFSPIGIGSGTLWTGILAVMYPYIGWRATVALLVAESLMLTFHSFNIPVLSVIFFYTPVVSFVTLFVTFFWGAFVSFFFMYVGADILGVRKYLKRVFP